MYTFVHPTKSGGTSLLNTILAHYSEYFKEMGHKYTCNEENPVIVIREPFDRFLSMFNYWKYGSEKYPRDPVFL